MKIIFLKHSNIYKNRLFNSIRFRISFSILCLGKFPKSASKSIDIYLEKTWFHFYNHCCISHAVQLYIVVLFDATLSHGTRLRKIPRFTGATSGYNINCFISHAAYYFTIILYVTSIFGSSSTLFRLSAICSAHLKTIFVWYGTLATLLDSKIH